jgi:peptide/nickel transport system permease protein
MIAFLSPAETVLRLLEQFAPVWAALALILGASWALRARLGLYGRLFDSGAGLAGLTLVLFWALTALMADQVATLPPLEQFSAMKRKGPGGLDPETGAAFLLGADNLGRDLFSRMVHGARFVLLIAPAATAVAYAVGVLLGLPAGYWGGRIDEALTFLANLVLAFPVILLFYLLVTPGVRETALPQMMAGVFFLFPLALALAAIWLRCEGRPGALFPWLALTAGLGGWLYAGLVFGPPGPFLRLAPNELNIFAAVVFASSPGVFRIVRGLTMDIRTRDYVAAAQTRGERAWYVMLWEILPNARGPLIVDACLRVGYTAILLGALGFFGLGLAPESPDWGSMINQTRPFVRLGAYIVLPPVLALATLVLGLNLLADGLREQSLRD